MGRLTVHCISVPLPWSSACNNAQAQGSAGKISCTWWFSLLIFVSINKPTLGHLSRMKKFYFTLLVCNPSLNSFRPIHDFLVYLLSILIFLFYYSNALLFYSLCICLIWQNRVDVTRHEFTMPHHNILPFFFLRQGLTMLPLLACNALCTPG